MSEMQSLFQCIYPREKLCERRSVLVSAHQPLPMAAQAQQGSVLDGYVDVVAIGLYLLSERAVVSAVDGLKQQRFACEKVNLCQKVSSCISDMYCISYSIHIGQETDTAFL